MQATGNPIRIEPNAGWLLEQLLRPAHEAGDCGDFVVSRRAGSRMQLFVGDATGHGPDAARIAADARRLIDRDADREITPDLLAGWNAELEPLHPTKFVCLTYIEIDFATGRARLANSGNPEVLVVRSGGTVESYPATGMPLGVVEPGLWHAPELIELDLAADDAIVCVTDGVTEQAGPRRQRFGIERVLHAVKSATVDRLVSFLDECLTRFAAGVTDHDDRTMLCIGRALARAA